MTKAGPVRAYIGLGSNQGERLVILQTAVQRIATLPSSQLLAVSALYRSRAAEGAAGSDDFFNAALALETQLSPYTLLAALQGLETQAGRERPYHHAPRTLDLDLLLYGEQCICDGPELLVPHARMMLRDFVLRPLLDIYPADQPLYADLKRSPCFEAASILGNSCEIACESWTQGVAL